MQKKESISEVARKIVDLRKQLDTVTELKEKAFTPCNPNSYFYLKELGEFISAWSNLCNWTSYTESGHYGSLHIKSYNDLMAKFNLLSRALINREEFCNSPVVVASCADVEKYIDDLTKEISKLEKQLDTLYNQFVKSTGYLSFIFKESKVKDIIINKILFS